MISAKVKTFTDKLSFFTPEDREKVISALQRSEELHTGQTRASGEPYVVHPIEVAEILLDMQMDAVTIIAALLHDTLEDTQIERNELRAEFGKQVEALVFGVTKIDDVRAKSKNHQETETIRKMMFAMVKDIRVILIKLADKLHNMRTLQFKDPPRRKVIAQECIDIYAPIAGRLGMSSIKDELEDLSLKYLQSEVYEQIKRAVSQKKTERANYLERAKKALEDAANAEGIVAEVETRAKHFYSIYRKMKIKGKGIDEIYDMLGLRILCENSHECYMALGIVHRLWMPIEGRFKDYIAMPKSNKYQSLHTTVMGYDGRLLEIQIRTREMHMTAEYGVAAHWLYKQGLNNPDKIKLEDLSFISRLRDLNQARIASSEFLEEMKSEVLRDSIYVFTPRGDVFQLPQGATALDFAYHVHTEVGHHTSGAKADGSIISLREPLSNTQVVEILTNPQAHPHLEWLRIVKTSRSRSKIRAWLNHHDESLIIEQNIVARKRKKESESEETDEGKKPRRPNQFQDLKRPPNRVKDTEKVGVRVGDERNVLIRFANCCNPEVGDPILGYVSRGRGIIIHKVDCTNLASIADFEERRVEVEWETVSPRTTHTFVVSSRQTQDLFSQIEGAIKKYRGHLLEGKVDPNNLGNLEGHFTIEIERNEDYQKVLKNIRSIPSVLTIRDVTRNLE
ncbi:MAG: bifunctional (p)ppGpp synthetase/guanosine-3',5'-bis(diphosphate) 3'-pyrophosphohydrolase [Spirochaetales bacterium]|nr:bifunctional (p)ppGpp synthetase/guanosine-3',5'-bis(diphosphate) 3'-pyrophosphohydrolase [Spirochaetales bacterium]